MASENLPMKGTVYMHSNGAEIEFEVNELKLQTDAIGWSFNLWKKFKAAYIYSAHLKSF